MVKSKRIDVKVAGSLSSLISEAEKFSIEDLTLSGYLNGSDIKFIRDISCFYSPLRGELSSIDLENANIVAGGDPYLSIIRSFNGIDETVNFQTVENTISEGMFSTTSLEYITLPKNITVIEDDAFMDSKKLKSITIPESVTSIGYNAFWCCIQLNEIDIPRKTSFIGNGAFGNCDSLVRIKCKNPTPPQVGKKGSDDNYLFLWDRSISETQKNGALYVPPKSASLYKRADIWMNFNNIIENMQSYNITTFEDTYQSFSNYFINKSGRDKYNKISEKILLSKKLAELHGLSIQMSGTPSARDFLSAIKSMPYFMFAGTDTTILACLLAIKQWDEKVNSVYHFAPQHTLDSKVQSVFKMFGISGT